MADPVTILLIDDDKEMNDLVGDYLGGFGYRVLAATHPNRGMEILREEKPGLVVLDVMLPGRNGFEVCKEIRRESDVPVVMLTARGDVSDRVLGLGLGADDYLPKPFEPRELVARIESILRRVREPQARGVLKSGNLEVDLRRRAASLGGEALELTTMEFDILSLLMRRPGEILDREAISAGVKGMGWDPADRTVDVVVGRLRQKLRDDPKKPAYVKTVWGAGYLFIGVVESHD
jgi:DNA-binding response OmpR family regulator